MTAERMTVDVPQERRGSRLDRFLVELVPGRTRSALQRLIADGLVLVDGVPASKPGQSLEPGSRIVINLPEPPAAAPRPEAIPLDVVHEDDDLIVIDKPSGLVVHPGAGRHDGTLVAALLGRGTTLASCGAPQRPGIVHRLDRETSGLIVVAKNDTTHHALAAAFAERTVRKTYLALVWGRPRPAAGTIDRPIGRSRSNPTAMSVQGVRGRARDASTAYRTLESPPGFALVEARPHTGRTHQIRVHLQAIGHSIVGDPTYAGRSWNAVQDPIRRAALRQMGRLALHAAGLRLTHPRSGATLDLASPLPADLQTLLEVLRAAG